jgi:hypothetical protein
VSLDTMTAGLHNDQINFVCLKDGGEIIAIGGGEKERVLTCFAIEEAAHRIKSAWIQSENPHGK